MGGIFRRANTPLPTFSFSPSLSFSLSLSLSLSLYHTHCLFVFFSLLDCSRIGLLLPPVFLMFFGLLFPSFPTVACCSVVYTVLTPHTHTHTLRTTKPQLKLARKMEAKMSNTHALLRAGSGKIKTARKNKQDAVDSVDDSGPIRSGVHGMRVG